MTMITPLFYQLAVNNVLYSMLSYARRMDWDSKFPTGTTLPMLSCRIDSSFSTKLRYDLHGYIGLKGKECKKKVA